MNCPPSACQFPSQAPPCLDSVNISLLNPRPNTASLLIPVLTASGAELNTPPNDVHDELHTPPDNCFVYIPPSVPIPKTSTWLSPETTAARLLWKTPPSDDQSAVQLDLS